MARQPVTVIGVPQIVKKLEPGGSFERALLASIVLEVDKTRDEIVVEAKKEAPFKSGALAGTIRKEGPIRPTGKNLLGSIIAGGPSDIAPGGTVDYAASQHEIHPTRSKFIERPALKLAQRLPDRFKRAFLRVQRV